jgi:predicted enzyme related to lactoylglutathione lyase
MALDADRSHTTTPFATITPVLVERPSGKEIGMIRSLQAQSTVTDLDRAEGWYAHLFERVPDARPMPGLLEWHLGESFGVQVWSEPDRAGHSSMVLNVTDLDATADRLAAAGIAHAGPQQVTASRILMLTDPDGNRVMLTGA